MILFHEFTFNNELLDKFIYLDLDEEAIKYYLEAVYVAVNQLEDMEYIYNHASRSTVDFLLTEAIKYAKFMIGKE